MQAGSSESEKLYQRTWKQCGIFFFSDRGLSYWSEGVDQDFSTFNKYSHIRTKWGYKDFTEDANLQIRFIPSKNKDKTTISFHLDKLKNESQRKVTREYWSKVIEDLKLLLEP